MGQLSGRWIAPIFLSLLAALSGPGCDRGAPAKPPATAAPAAATNPAATVTPCVASLVPAATDLLLAMGAGDHLVAVSNYDHDPRVALLPRVGDYLTTDWEQISQVRPQVIVVQYGGGKLPEGFKQRADALGIRLVNLRIERLEDIFAAIRLLGEAAGEAAKAETAARALRARLDAIQSRFAGEPPVPALIVTSEDGRAVAGPGTYLDDLLAIAGGSNAARPLAERYATLDREKLLSLRPRAVIQLLPGASPQVEAQARRTWEALPELPAVRGHRVVFIVDRYAELPGYEVGELAERFADALHGSPRRVAR